MSRDLYDVVGVPGTASEAESRHAVWVLQGKKMAVLGLAFKGGTDDIRESPALRVIRSLLEEGARLRVHDPRAIEVTQQELPPQAGRLEYCSSPYEAAQGADVLLILTPWQEYRELDWKRIHAAMEVPVVVDGRNLLDPAVLRSADFEYVDMGRGYAANSEPNSGQMRTLPRSHANGRVAVGS